MFKKIKMVNINLKNNDQKKNNNENLKIFYNRKYI